MQEIYQVVRAACDACVAELRPGVPAATVHAAGRQVIVDAGLERHRLHSSGYGIAPAFPPIWSEGINLTTDDPYVLAAGMVIAVEPPLFIHEERLGARLVDNMLITETGAEFLSRATRDLVVVD